jgi:hypothetical protein
MAVVVDTLPVIWAALVVLAWRAAAIAADMLASITATATDMAARPGKSLKVYADRDTKSPLSATGTEPPSVLPFRAPSSPRLRMASLRRFRRSDRELRSHPLIARLGIVIPSKSRSPLPLGNTLHRTRPVRAASLHRLRRARIAATQRRLTGRNKVTGQEHHHVVFDRAAAATSLRATPSITAASSALRFAEKKPRFRTMKSALAVASFLLAEGGSILEK